MQFMLDEYEIVCWINFIDRFSFFNFAYDVNDVKQVVDATFTHIVYIAAATKIITNDDAYSKKVILFNVFGSKGVEGFHKFFGNPEFGPKFDEHTENVFLKNHQILKQLDKGYEREFTEDLNLPDVVLNVSSWEDAANQLNSEVQEQIRLYELSKNNLNLIVDNICTQSLKKRKKDED